MRTACPAALLGVHRTTLEQLAAELSTDRLLLRGLAPINRTVREALAARITEAALRQNSLRYFTPVARMRGFARALATTLNELRLEAIRPGDLRTTEDLAVLLQHYESELAASNFADRAERFRTAINVVDAFEHAWAKIPAVILDVRPRHKLEGHLIEALERQAPDLLVLRLAGDGEAGLPPASHGPQTALGALQQNLFSGAVQANGTHLVEQPPASFQLFSAPGEALECVEIARRIAKLASEGVRFDEMAVLLRSPERYGPLLSEAFRRAGISVYFAQSTRRPDPAGRALLSLLHCAIERLSASRFLEYLSLGQLPELAGPSTGWERLIVQASIIEGDAQRWKQQLAASEARNGSSPALEALQLFALPLIEQLSDLPAAATWGEWLAILRSLTDSSIRNPDAIHELINELEPMSAIGPIDLHAVILTVEEHLRFLRRSPEQERYGSIFVGSIDDARGMNFRVVFIPGLNEGTFPTRVREDPLLLDEKRQQIGLAAPPEDTELFRTAVSTAAERVVLSFSRIDLVTGRPRVPSFYVFEAYEAAFGISPDVAELQEQARHAVETRIDWPAPHNPEDAIDDAEFDLAQLKPAFEQGVAGAGAYLADVNPYALPSLRMRYRRWNTAWTFNDGLVQLEQEAIALLQQYRLARRPWSPSALEQFAVCPYRFALRGIFNMRPAERPVLPQRMDPSVRGEIFHRVVAGFLREQTAPVLEETLDKAKALLDTILDRIASELEDLLAPAIPPVWAAEVESLRTDLHGWLRNAATAGSDWTPLHAEWSFGLDNTDAHDAASQAEPVAVLDGYLLRGSVDLIEQSPSRALRVTDLKTGAMPKHKPYYIGEGEVLQPVLYALAVESAMQGPVTGTRLYYATLRQNYTEIPISLGRAKEEARRVLKTIDRSIDTGFLPAAPKENACATCDYLQICGPYEEERTSRKPVAELKPLIQIRRTS